MKWKKVVGVLLIGLGIIGLFLPFLQGIAMIFGGLVLIFGKKKAMRILKRMKSRLTR